ncbi:hypothetical protein C8R43DRAFT_269845 [Mycena crocata]|nr:hypothetical protein C8R43DRAFT_269845 [Mycena crocata]
MQRKPMNISTPEYTPEIEYTLDLGAESEVSTPLVIDDSNITPTQRDDVSPILPRRRSWRSSSQDPEKTPHSGAYDAAGRLKIAARARKEARRDCGICEEVASPPVRTLCCGALFCRAHISVCFLSNPMTYPNSRGVAPRPPSDGPLSRLHCTLFCTCATNERRHAHPTVLAPNPRLAPAPRRVSRSTRVLPRRQARARPPVWLLTGSSSIHLRRVSRWIHTSWLMGRSRSMG